jgi:uncharacterized membrane protein
LTKNARGFSVRDDFGPPSPARRPQPPASLASIQIKTRFVIACMLPLSRKAGVMGSNSRPAADQARTAPCVMLVLALIGIVDAFYDSYAIHAGQLLWCPPPIDGCNTVANSPYARIFGVPVGYVGVVYYLCMFALAARLAFGSIHRGLRSGAVLGAATGVSFSMYFMYVQLTFIHAFCIYCLISAVLTLLLLIAALWHFRETRTARILAPA